MAISTKPEPAAKLGFEQTLWAAADKLRGHMDAAEYKHVVLGLIFLKYISDAFEEKHAQLQAETGQGAGPEDKDEYLADNIFWVPKEARRSFTQANAVLNPKAELLPEFYLKPARLFGFQFLFLTYADTSLLLVSPLFEILCSQISAIRWMLSGRKCSNTNGLKPKPTGTALIAISVGYI